MTTQEKKQEAKRRRRRRFSTTCQVNFCLTLVVVVYLCGGAYIFMVIDAPYRQGTPDTVTKSQNQLLGQLWDLRVADHENWTSEIGALLAEYESSVIDHYEATSSWRPWDFSTCLYMTLMAITTIGYGDIAPITQTGRFLMFIYSVIGVPLNLLFLSNFGILLASFTSKRFKLKKIGKVVKKAARKTGRRLNNNNVKADANGESVKQNGSKLGGVQSESRDNCNQSNGVKPDNKYIYTSTAEQRVEIVGENLQRDYDVEIQTADDVSDDPDNAPIIDPDPEAKGKALGALSVIYVLYTVLGGVFMYFTEYDWTYVDSIYCTFISLATIGFGDLIPGGGVLREYPVLRPVVYLLFTYIGLIIFSACFALSVEKIRYIARKIRRRLENSGLSCSCSLGCGCEQTDANEGSTML